MNGRNVVFLVGSPRSGTTLLGDILDLHPCIARWYEPSFILDRDFREASHDRRTTQDATPEVKRFLLKEFERFKQTMRCSLLVDKSPYNSLKICFLNEVFPYGKFIHLVRDGRDAVLSIHREWQRRQMLLKGGWTQLPSRLRTVWRSIQRQPTWEYRIQALFFQLGGPFGLFKRDQWLPYVRWEGRIGWGPRFPGWQDVIDKVTPLEFSALQWKACLETISTDSEHLHLDEYRMIEIRYEDLLNRPEENLQRVFDFLGVPLPKEFMALMPPLKRGNYGKWRTAFTQEEKALIGPIINPLLIQLGYADSDEWYRSKQAQPKG